MSGDIHICGCCLEELHDLNLFINHKKVGCNRVSKCEDKAQVLVLDESTDGMLSVLSSPQKLSLSLQHSTEQIRSPSHQQLQLRQLLSQHTTEQINVSSHQQLQLRQLLDAQKVNMSGIDMTKVIVLNTTKAELGGDQVCIQLPGEPQPDSRMQQNTILTYDQLQKLVNSTNTVLQDIVLQQQPVTQAVSQPLSQPVSQLISQSITQTVSQPITQTVSQPVSQTVRLLSASDVLGSQNAAVLTSNQVSIFVQLHEHWLVIVNMVIVQFVYNLILIQT